MLLIPINISHVVQHTAYSAYISGFLDIFSQHNIGLTKKDQRIFVCNLPFQDKFVWMAIKKKKSDQ